MSDQPDASLETPRQPVAIDLISDIICPWCYVGFRALIEACVKSPNIATGITMRPFELDSTTPKAGVDHKARLLAKFGGDTARLNDIRKTLYDAGAAVGIEFNLDAIKISPNTRDCHRLLLWARSMGVEILCAEALFLAYHVEGEDLSQAGTLVSIARGIGMDGELVAELLASDSDMDRVESELRTGVQMGITGVPCAVLNQKFAVMGAQSVDAFMSALDQASRAAAPT